MQKLLILCALHLSYNLYGAEAQYPIIQKEQYCLLCSAPYSSLDDFLNHVCQTNAKAKDLSSLFNYDQQHLAMQPQCNISDLIHAEQDLVNFTALQSEKTDQRISITSKQSDKIAILLEATKAGARVRAIIQHQACAGIYTCDEPACTFQSATKIKLLRHMIIHTHEKPFICKQPTCKEAFLNESRLRKHASKHAADTQSSKVSVLLKKTTAEMRVKTIVQHQYGAGIYTCDEPGCNAQYKYRSLLLRHMVKHTNEKLFICDHADCKKAFTDKLNLTLHKKIHKKGFPCPQSGCSKEFRLLSQLEHHQKTHTRELRHVCALPNCESSFYSDRPLRKHILNEHGATKRDLIAKRHIGDESIEHDKDVILIKKKLCCL